MLRILPVFTLLLFAIGCVPHHVHPGPDLNNRLSSYRDQSAPTPRPEPPPTTSIAPAPLVSPKPSEPGGAAATAVDREVKDALESINKLLDAYFDFNAYLLRPDAIEAVTQAAGILQRHMAADRAIRLIVEGHCDERGSAEFNLALGDRRAESVRELLQQLGLEEGRMTTISYGEARPECGDSTEACWQKNRRAHIRHER